MEGQMTKKHHYFLSLLFVWVPSQLMRETQVPRKCGGSTLHFGLKSFKEHPKGKGGKWSCLLYLEKLGGVMREKGGSKKSTHVATVMLDLFLAELKGT